MLLPLTPTLASRAHSYQDCKFKQSLISLRQAELQNYACA